MSKKELKKISAKIRKETKKTTRKHLDIMSRKDAENYSIAHKKQVQRISNAC